MELWVRKFVGLKISRRLRFKVLVERNVLIALGSSLRHHWLLTLSSLCEVSPFQSSPTDALQNNENFQQSGACKSKIYPIFQLTITKDNPTGECDQHDMGDVTQNLLPLEWLEVSIRGFVIASDEILVLSATCVTLFYNETCALKL